MRGVIRQPPPPPVEVAPAVPAFPSVAVTVMRDTYRDGSRRGLTVNHSDIAEMGGDFVSGLTRQAEESGLHQWRGPKRPSLLHPRHLAALLFTPFTPFADEESQRVLKPQLRLLPPQRKLAEVSV